MENKIRVKVKIGEYEVEIGLNDQEDLKNALDMIDKIVEKLKKDVLVSTPIATVEKTIDREDLEISEEIPQIKPGSIKSNVLQLLNSKWGKAPRTLKELKDALEMNALHYPMPTLGSILTKLTKRGSVRRLKKGNVYSYVIAQKGRIDLEKE